MFSKLLSDIVLPPMYAVTYSPPVLPAVEPTVALDTGLADIQLPELRGKTVALTCGSRDIGDIVLILRHLSGRLRQKGALPFIVPAMGSHGGATAEGQIEILKSLGVTEESIGVPICSSMDTDVIAVTQSGIPVHMDRNAHAADFVIPVGRVKPHTEFHGDIESGVLKMLAIGLGKQKGASVCHSLGRENLSRNITEIGLTALKNASIPFAVAIVENSNHASCKVVVLPPEQILEKEKELLRLAKQQVPRIPFSGLDVLAVYEMGKDISGTGMDSNVTGRSVYLPPAHPYANILTVFRLTEKSHHNANGIGCADITVKQLVDSISPQETYPNAITSCDTRACRIPVYMPDDKQAMLLSVHFSGASPSARIVMIKNTLSLHKMYVSEPLLEADGLPAEAVCAPEPTALFNSTGNFIETLWSVAEAND